jgi:hypothetical protein
LAGERTDVVLDRFQVDAPTLDVLVRGGVRGSGPDVGVEEDAAVFEAVGDRDRGAVVAEPDIDAEVDLRPVRDGRVALELRPGAGGEPGVAASGPLVEVEAAPVVLVGVGPVELGDQVCGSDPGGGVAGADQAGVVEVALVGVVGEPYQCMRKPLFVSRRTRRKPSFRSSSFGWLSALS